MDEYACLRVFQHPDIVTSVRFHPGTANLFATGCADGRVRMWEVASGKVSFMVQGWQGPGQRDEEGEGQGAHGDERVWLWEVASGKVSFWRWVREEDGEGQWPWGRLHVAVAGDQCLGEFYGSRMAGAEAEGGGGGASGYTWG